MKSGGTASTPRTAARVPLVLTISLRLEPVNLTVWQRKRECTPLAVLTLEVDLPSQQLRQLLTQVQAQPGPLLAAPQVILDVGERLKYFALVFGRDTYAGVVHTELRP